MKFRKAVTLVELMIVMIIVAILSVVIFVSMTGAIEEAEAANIEDYRSNLNTVLLQHQQYLITRSKGKDDFLPGGVVRAACLTSLSRGTDDSLTLTAWYGINGAAKYMPDAPEAPYTDSLYIYVPDGEAAMRTYKVGTGP